MSLAVYTNWEVQTGGSDTANSGGFRGGALIAPPSAPSVAHAGSGGTVAANTYYCVITYTDGVGETVISGETSQTTTGTTSTITVTSPSAASGAVTWSCYFGTTSGGPYFPQGTTLTIGSNRVVTSTPPTSGTQPRGVDYSIASTTPNISDTNASANGTTTVTDSSVTFTGSHVGNVALIGGAYYDIVGVTDATHIVVDRSITTGSGLTIIIGGPFASPGGACAQAVTGNYIYVKAGTYTIANGTNNTAGNKFTITNVSMIGYNTNRYPGNTDTQPVFDAGANSVVMASTNGGNGLVFENFSFTNSTAKTGVTGLSAGANQGVHRRLSFASMATGISPAGNGNKFIDCYLTACGAVTASTNYHQFLRCVSLNSTGNGFAGNGGTYFDECVAAGMAGIGIVSGTAGVVKNCIAYGATGANHHGIQLSTNDSVAINCIAYGNAGMGFNVNTVLPVSALDHCASGGNTGANFDTNFPPSQLISTVTLTANPFTNAGSNDFSLNTTAGGGAACRGAGIPGTWLGLSTTGYRDIGLAQSQASTGSAMRARVFTGM